MLLRIFFFYRFVIYNQIMTNLKQDTEHRDVLTRMMRLAEKSEENAAETLKQLHDQGQALDRI